MDIAAKLADLDKESMALKAKGRDLQKETDLVRRELGRRDLAEPHQPLLAAAAARSLSSRVGDWVALDCAAVIGIPDIALAPIDAIFFRMRSVW